MKKPIILHLFFALLTIGCSKEHKNRAINECDFNYGLAVTYYVLADAHTGYALQYQFKSDDSDTITHHYFIEESNPSFEDNNSGGLSTGTHCAHKGITVTKLDSLNINIICVARYFTSDTAIEYIDTTCFRDAEIFIPRD